MTDRDPNEGSTDPMVAEFWQLGEAVQDRLIEAGFESETVEGIAVDIHDLLQASERINSTLAPAILEAKSAEELQTAIAALKWEMDHIRWHGQNASDYLQSLPETQNLS